MQAASLPLHAMVRPCYCLLCEHALAYPPIGRNAVFVLHEAEMDAFKVVVPCLATLCVFRLGIKMHAEQQCEHV
jgi:hypothetical protein